MSAGRSPECTRPCGAPLHPATNVAHRHTSRQSFRWSVGLCMVFTSTDRLHRQLTPLFADLGQAFLWGPDLKAGLAEPWRTARRTPMNFARGASSAPLEAARGIANSITALWDQFLPSWRTSDDASPPSPPPPEDELMRRIKT